jgi:hypothetical protein
MECGGRHAGRSGAGRDERVLAKPRRRAGGGGALRLPPHGQGALIGFGTGIAWAFVGAVACFSNQDGRKENYCALGFVFAPVLGAIGAVAGAGIGAMLHAESWQTVPLAPR